MHVLLVLISMQGRQVYDETAKCYVLSGSFQLQWQTKGGRAAGALPSPASHPSLTTH